MEKIHSIHKKGHTKYNKESIFYLRLGLAKLTGMGESRDNTVSMNLWSEK